MQIFNKKITIYFSFLITLLVQNAFSQQVNEAQLKQADLALKEKKIDLADSLFKSYVQNNKSDLNPLIYLKLSYIASQKQHYVEELIYLNSYVQKKPDEAIVDKMLEIATINNLNGYEKDSIIFLKNIFRLLLPYFLIFCIPFFFYALFLFFKRKLRKEDIKRRSIFVLSLGVILILFLINAENNLDEAIVLTDNAILKKEPYPTQEVAEFLPKGTKLNVIGSTDIWLRILTDKVYYIKKTDVHLIQK